MNTEHLLAVADAIEHASIPDLGFNMCDFLAAADQQHPDHSGRACGTVACIGGWAYSLAKHATPPAYVERYSPAAQDVFDTARDFLALTEESAERLFFVEGLKSDGYGADDEDLERITPAQAVAVLRHAAATGEIDWARVLEPTETAS